MILSVHAEGAAMSKTDKPKGRTAEKIGFSAPAGTLATVDAAAEKDGRNRSNWIVQAIREKLTRTK